MLLLPIGHATAAAATAVLGICLLLGLRDHHILWWWGRGCRVGGSYMLLVSRSVLDGPRTSVPLGSLLPRAACHAYNLALLVRASRRDGCP